MSDQNPLETAGDPPIIVQGGGSVNIFVPSSFTDQATSGYTQAGGVVKDKDFKNDNVNLISLQIDEDTPITLNKTSKITINYK
jgi:hypothetical protein